LDTQVISSEAPTGFLRIGLWAGVAYFCCMAVAHFFGFKYPLLFVYYDVPFYAYQDKIISFAVVAYVCLFVNAALNRSAVPFALIALGVTVLGLSAVNVSAALAAVLDGRSTRVYWLQTGLIAAYLVWLLVLYSTNGRRESKGFRSASVNVE
jgi:hypothetical protein